MLDIGWSELLLIAVVAIVVIGPKDLPDALRTLGRMTSKLRRMAGEFQGQFKQALREANLESVKQDFDDIRQSAAVLKGSFNPVEMAKSEIKGAITGSTPSAGSSDPTLTNLAPVVAPPVVSLPAQAEPAEASAREEAIPSAFATLPAFRK
jgi:sec-independent protein translocase protein TatB